VAAINYFTSTYGTDPWRNITLYWDGDTATNYKIYQVGNPTALYNGTAKTYAFTGAPSTRYDFRLEATVSAVVYTSTITVFTRALPAPVGLTVGSITDTTASLTWQAVGGATTYDIGDVTDDYTVLYNQPGVSKALSGLTKQTRYSMAVRTISSGVYSRWSAPVTFTTAASGSITAGTYEFRPTAVHVWAAGRPGSTSPVWRATADDWYHGEGFTWGDNTGVQSTFFFYGANPFSALTGGTVTAIQVYCDRAGGGDPAAVLSRWGLHPHQTLPGGAPTFPGTESDVGSFARNEAGWVSLPNAWGTTLIAGTQSGVYWGDAPERFQSARNQDISVTPRHGDLKITVT